MGRPDQPIICDPTVFDETDYILLESTYGDRVHQSAEDIKKQMAEVVNSTEQAGGSRRDFGIVAPSLAGEVSGGAVLCKRIAG